MTAEQERAFLQQNAEAPSIFYLIAEVAGEIAGTLTFSTGKRPRLRHAGEFGMTVLRKYWNLEIGSQLLASMIAWARQSGTIHKINLRVRVDNLPAIHLYEKYGFVQEGRLTRAFSLHGQFVDVYLMGLQADRFFLPLLFKSLRAVWLDSWRSNASARRVCPGAHIWTRSSHGMYPPEGSRDKHDVKGKQETGAWAIESRGD